MSEILLDKTLQEQWRNLVCAAAENCEYNLDEELESYLVFMLIRFMQRPDIADAIIATDYMEGQAESGTLKVEHLREVGDKCLIFSGLFPEQAKRRLVNLGYYINMGRSSYSQISVCSENLFAKLYNKLAHYFVLLTDVLHSMRELDGSPIMGQREKYRFWVDFDSDYAKKSMFEFFGVVPVRSCKF